MPHQSMMLVERAAEKPRMLKLISVAVHRASPPITGIRERFTSNPAKKKKRVNLSLIAAFLMYPMLAFERILNSEQQRRTRVNFSYLKPQEYFLTEK